MFLVQEYTVRTMEHKTEPRHTHPSRKLDPVRDSLAGQWELDGPLNMVLVQGYPLEKL